ncbi:class I SAM-dependent methyltransferase [Brevundimonas sp. WCHBH090558]|uniref:class I SAM-dependent methyltransferase n=1 Tax=Brevundimonas huaxiensis TaxID=2725493 RepID=UPI0016292079|nr:class I SAM-dependent methyltransferase [Brevundimonas huaxiensis]MBC1182184.1 class I SAM-dependent methyltransferase [Brevundimonas huaxiensis]
MTHPSAKRIVGLYRDKADDWVRDRGATLYSGDGGVDEAVWLDRFVADLPAGASILDVGCGSGWPIEAALLERGHQVTGMDASPGLIAHAQATLPTGVWSVADMRAEFPAGPFDGVLAWHSLFHLSPDDQSRVLPALAACVAEGGRLMFTSGQAHGETIGQWRGEPLYHASLDPEAYRALLADAGLRVEYDGAKSGVWLARRAFLSAK